SQQQADELPDAKLWRRGEAITTPGEPLRLDAERASELGVAWRVVEKFDDLKRLYGFEGDVRVAEPSWADELVEILASDQVAILLLMVGFVGVYVELNAPGVGIGGFLATVAFMLFFWSKFTAQTADWLEVMLFITGVIFILVELLVLPGFGVFGLGGAGLVVTSLILASQTFLLPKTASQLAELRGSIGVVVTSLVAFLVAAMLVRRYLPHSPLMRGVLLAPPEAEELIELDHRESVADFSHLVGMRGVATTNLLPSGRAEIDGELVDVLADHGMIDRGDAVVVVKTRGSRVIVSKA
ncbi:MAG: NfeD family protein, partial [Planctomycetota bacterium]